MGQSAAIGDREDRALATRSPARSPRPLEAMLPGPATTSSKPGMTRPNLVAPSSASVSRRRARGPTSCASAYLCVDLVLQVLA
jgi:hypothetical protein